MTVVVTGASGHIGNNLVRALLQRGVPVRAVVHRSMTALEDLVGTDGFGTVKASLDDPPSLRAAFDGAEQVVHCAGVISIAGDPTGAVRSANVDGARSVARAAQDAGVRRLAHLSSVHAFAHRPDRPIDERAPRPTATHPIYDQTKAAGEAAVRDQTTGGRMEVVIVNPTGVLGPYDFGPSRLGTFWCSLAAGRLPALVDGAFDWCDVRDVCEGILLALDRGRHHENYVLSGHLAPVVELARMARKHTGVAPPWLVSPRWLALLGLPFVTAWSRLWSSEALYTSEAIRALAEGRSGVCSDKAHQQLGYAPRPLEQTVADSHGWLARHGALPPVVASRVLGDPQ